MNYFEHVRNVFSLEHLPANVRVSRFMARWPFIRRYQRFPVGLGFLPTGGKFSYQRNGQKHGIQFNGRNLQFHALYEEHYRNGYELETALLISTLCRGSSSFFDIGSNWGYFSLLVASLPDFSGKIFAFEPNPRTFADLTSVIKQTEVSSRVQACHMGVGRTACELSVAEADPFNSGLSRLTADGGSGEKIPVKPVDALDFPAPGMIKIDAEGMELDILAGAVNTLAQAKPFVILENFLDFEAPGKTYATIDLLEQNSYRTFVPALEFLIDGHPVLATYGSNFTPLVERGGTPRLGLVEISGGHRFLLPGQLNLLGVHASRVEELWKLGISDFGKI